MVMTAQDFSMLKQSKEKWQHISIPYRMKMERVKEGFDHVQQVMHDFYKNLLGRQHCTRKSINMQVI